MSIVKMKRIRLIALDQDKEALMADLLHMGCVEVGEPGAGEEDGGRLLRREDPALPQARSDQNELKQALETINRYAPQKGGGMFAPREQMQEKTLLDPQALEQALTLARQVNSHARAIGACAARETRLLAEQASLRPWENDGIPLEQQMTRTVLIWLGTVASAVDFSALAGAVQEAAEAVEIQRLSADREQQYLLVLCHRSCEEKALEALRSFGFSFAQMKEFTGTVRENLQRLDGELKEAAAERQRELEALQVLGQRKKELLVAQDRVRQVIAKETAKERLLTGGALLVLEGWVPVPETRRLERLLAGYDCAYELTDPAEEDYPQVPVQLKNSPLTRSMNVVTEMYSLPAYNGVDPNPLMAPFFITFFGIMMADMGYGLLMVLGALFVLMKAKPLGSTRNFAELVLLCGISTFVVGAMTGGFFGDFIPQLLAIIHPGSTFVMPALFTPLDDTVAIMLGSLVLGAVQVVTGMTVSVVKKTKDGNFIDALFDEITWWIILAGVGLAIFGVGTVSGVPVVLVVGALMLVFGGTRKAKGFGKVSCLVGLIYNGVTGFFSDILSYVRLMALMLSGSVIASVFNTLGATFGSVIPFIIVSMIGNALNLALNLLGCYVHDLRLQCLEFFNRFYQEGGKPYKPLAIQTKYVDIIKEEQ